MIRAIFAVVALLGVSGCDTNGYYGRHVDSYSGLRVLCQTGPNGFTLTSTREQCARVGGVPK
jgi:hypothetical protein